MSAKITILPNGPMLVSGQVEIIGVNGKPLERMTPSVSLCRCSQSKVKPFCDGAHRACGFKDAAPSA